MDKFDRYFKGASVSQYDKLVNSYVDYSTDYSHHYLYTNGYSIVMCDFVRTDFKENLGIKDYVVRTFENFIDKTSIESIITYDYDYIKNNGVKDGKDMIFKFNDNYSINITLLNKIKAMIGCNKINYIIKSDNYHPIIEIVGKNMNIYWNFMLNLYISTINKGG